ncbi:peptide-N4-asparagine amidase [Luteibacter sp. CQ10]|uniref:peptide-N4-asparagine amidase n=1 Tax=Luteibacter sp. CQ10 TaxID=2805821 RepID=UPI0034A3A276
MSVKATRSFAMLASLALASMASLADTTPSLREAASTEPRLARPPGTACEVPLFEDHAFGQTGDPKAMTATPLAFDYRPPEGCAGPWAKVVLEADFSVPAGKQYDRTASIWLGGANVYFGTTQEPDAKNGASWHVERDLTDYAALFRSARPGQAIVNNWLSERYTSAITGSARLVFYPAGAGAPQGVAADAVYPLGADPRGNATIVQDGRETLSRTLTLPRNVTQAYLDVIAQSQGNDEPWYTCIDDAYVARTQTFALESPYEGAPLQECGGGNLRQVLVSIDNQPAGLAPVYPWTYTGGVDPHLWRPIPDIQTLNFTPYRVDLTPFAALLDDGRPHDVSVRVLGANRFFNLAASLLIHQDAKRETLTGKLISNDLAARSDLGTPHVESTLHAASDGRIEGTVNTTRKDSYRIVGQLETSRGTVRTEVAQVSSFANRQTFMRPDAPTWHQVIDQASDTDETTTTRVGNAPATERHRTSSYPLRLDVTKHVAKDGSFHGVIDMTQGLRVQKGILRGGDRAFDSHLDVSMQSRDEADFNSMGSSIANSRHQHSIQRLSFKDSLGSCVDTTLESRGEAMSHVTQGNGCDGGSNRLGWRSTVMP